MKGEDRKLGGGEFIWAGREGGLIRGKVVVGGTDTSKRPLAWRGEVSE